MMKEFVEYVVKALVDHPEQVDVREVDGERVVVFELRLNQTDVGKIIGKSGRTITAIRTLLTSAAAKQGKRAMLEIIEPGGRRPQGEAPEAEAPPADETSA
ncbi:MAG TPA: KH domain-containing protein [Verrucomicrobiae bacterium]|nr:KH domain-containing protein [Verrucomicrobiae bacterium]